MPSTRVSLHYHVVYSTKDRRAFMDDSWREWFHAWLGGAVRSAGGVGEAVGGTGDHVHLLIERRSTYRLADVLRNLKGASSESVHQ